MTVHCWGEDPRGLWTVIVTDNDNNNREHYLKKLTQGDEEDVTRIFLDDTAKDRQTGQSSSKKDNGEDHILKTMEDTAGKIFKQSGFTKFGKKPQHIRNKLRVKVTKKKVSKENSLKSSVKHHDKKRKGGKMAHFKKHYWKTKAKSKAKINKVHHSWRGKHNNPNANVVKVKQERKVSKIHIASKKLTSKTVLSQEQEKLKAAIKKDNSNGERKKPNKVSKQQEFNATLTMEPKLASTLNKSSTSVVNDSSMSENATKALGLISQLISEIQNNPLVSKIALEALKNPAIGKLFGIDSSRDGTQNIQERLSPTKGVKLQAKDLTNGTNITGSGSDIDARIIHRSNGTNATSVREPVNHFKTRTARPGSIKSIKHRHIQFFKIIKDTQEDYKNDVSGSGIEGSGSSGSGHYFDGSGSGNTETLQVAYNQPSSCGGSRNCSGTQNEDSPLSLSSESPKELEGENDSYEIFDVGNESQYGDGDGDEVFESAQNPVGSDEDNDDLIPEFGFDVNTVNEYDLDLCKYLLDSSNVSSIDQKVHCPGNGTLEKHGMDERDKEDKNLAHYLAVDKLKSASGDYILDSSDDQDGSSSKTLNDDNSSSDQDDSDTAKYNNKDLEVLQEALEDQLSRLSKDPASQKSNAEILARVRDDIKRGDIDDLELLEAQITGGKTDISRVTRSRTPEDDEIDVLDNADETPDETPETFGGFHGEGEDLERRRISHQIDKEKSSQTYYVNPDKYGKVNSGILESWTLILYGTK